MNVEQLIKKLQKYPQDMLVFISGCDDCHDTMIGGLEVKDCMTYRRKPWGQQEEKKRTYDCNFIGPGPKCELLSRKMKDTYYECHDLEDSKPFKGLGIFIGGASPLPPGYGECRCDFMEVIRRNEDV